MDWGAPPCGVLEGEPAERMESIEYRMESIDLYDSTDISAIALAACAKRKDARHGCAAAAAAGATKTRVSVHTARIHSHRRPLLALTASGTTKAVRQSLPAQHQAHLYIITGSSPAHGQAVLVNGHAVRHVLMAAAGDAAGHVVGI